MIMHTEVASIQTSSVKALTGQTIETLMDFYNKPDQIFPVTHLISMYKVLQVGLM